MIQTITPDLQVILDIQDALQQTTAILSHIMTMVGRGDSKETIWDVYYFLSQNMNYLKDGKTYIYTATTKTDAPDQFTFTDVDFK
jgi:hypothetical protein